MKTRNFRDISRCNVINDCLWKQRSNTKSESKGGSNALVVSTFGLSEDIVKRHHRSI